MKCEYCVHNGVCYTQETCVDIEEQIKEFGCHAYKNKDNFINAPCKIGDAIYYMKRVMDDGTVVIGEGEVKQIVLDRLGGYITIDPIHIFPFDVFGKSVFLTREEAEAMIG